MKKILPLSAIILPDSATLAYKGSIFSVYEWPQTMFDGTTKTFEMLKRPDTVQIIAIDGDNIILVNDEQPGRSVRKHLPGGRVDEEDESWLIAAKREIQEETGLQFKRWRLVDVQQPVPKIEWFIPFYLATDISSRSMQALDIDGEKIEVVHENYLTFRKAVLAGGEPTMQYMIPLLVRCPTVQDLLKMAEFSGQEIER